MLRASSRARRYKGAMSKITLELPDDIAARLATPEGMARAQAAVVQAFAADDLSPEDERALDEAYESVRAGRTHPFDPEKARARANALLVAPNATNP